jgi:hypothetical protein
MGPEVQLQAFWTSALNGDEQSTSRPGHFTSGKRNLGNHWIGPEIEISSVDWAQQSRLLSEAETESSLRNVVFNKELDDGQCQKC